MTYKGYSARVAYDDNELFTPKPSTTISVLNGVCGGGKGALFHLFQKGGFLKLFGPEGPKLHIWVRERTYKEQITSLFYKIKTILLNGLKLQNSCFCLH
jgi:hypothetical protein